VGRDPNSFGFFEDDVVDTLVEVLGMSETAAHNWFNGTETAEISIAQLVSEIKDYVETASLTILGSYSWSMRSASILEQIPICF
jgi:nucleoside-diphosphate-sugar epimerase